MDGINQVLQLEHLQDGSLILFTHAVGYFSMFVTHLRSISSAGSNDIKMSLTPSD